MVYRDLGNKPSPVNRDHMKRPLNVLLCKKDIQVHLLACRVLVDSVLDCEAKLMLARAGKAGVIDVIHSIIYSLTHSLTHSLTPSLPPSLVRSFVNFFLFLYLLE